MKLLIALIIIWSSLAIENVQATAQSRDLTIGVWRCGKDWIPSTISITKEDGSFFKTIYWDGDGESRDLMIKKNDNLFFHENKSETSYVIINTQGDIEMWGESGNFATCKAVYKK